MQIKLDKQEMNESARTIADKASFQAFMNCYLREIDSGVWHHRHQWQLQTGTQFHPDEKYILELQLPKLNRALAVGVHFRSHVGRHTLATVRQKQNNEDHWQAIDPLSTLFLLINHIYFEKMSQQHAQLELISRLIESHQIMVQYLEERLNDPDLLSHSFIESEQSLLFGHWFHPTPKSRQGILNWQHKHYTPELCSHFKLHYFAVDRSLIQQNSILNISAEDIIKQIIPTEQRHKLCIDSDNQIILPVHPFQAQWLLHQNHVIELINSHKIIDIGPLGPLYTPTSSVRTLYSEHQPYMLKFSIPVKITNSMRINQHHELEAGVVIAKLLHTIHFSKQYPQFSTIPDPAYMTVKLDNDEENGFNIIVRENPFYQNKCHTVQLNTTNNVQSIAALVQDPITPGTASRIETIILSLSQKQNDTIADTALLWFEHYWHCAIEPVIQLYDQYGIALEAHQQNSLLRISDGLPCQYYYRDNQGFYLSNQFRDDLLKTEPSIINTPELFYDDRMIQDRFSYYLFVNQVFSIINRLAIDHLINETTLIAFCQKKLIELMQKTSSVGKEFIHRILHQRNLPCKGNLLTRIDDLDELQEEMELARYTAIPNPLCINIEIASEQHDNQEHLNEALYEFA